MKYKPDGFDRTIWVYPFTLSDYFQSKCSWKAKYGYETNCEVLSTYLTLLKKRGVKVGIADYDVLWS